MRLRSTNAVPPAAPRRWTLLALAVVVPLGFATKFYTGPAAGWVNHSLGGVFYELFWCLVALFLFPSASPPVIAGAVFGLTSALEFLQLWHPPLLEAVRSRFIGRTLLGTTFAWLDFPHYLAGCAVGWYAMTRLRSL